MLKIALTKGRLEQKTIEQLVSAGIDCTPLKDKGRKLIITLGQGQYEVVFAKAADVVTYVEHGIADVGIVGKDTLMEQQPNVCEFKELSFGKCRFALATVVGKDVYSGYNVKTIATKYPEVAKAFFAKKGLSIEIIKIDGSVELAPILNLADAIVDIVETGTTLKENGLEVIENIADISARLIVNPSSLKIKKKEILEFANKLS